MAVIGSIRLVSALENGTLDASGLEAALAVTKTYAEFQACLENENLFIRIMSSTNAANAVIGSATARTLIGASANARSIFSNASKSAKGKLCALMAKDEVTSLFPTWQARSIPVSTCYNIAHLNGRFIAFEYAQNNTYVSDDGGASWYQGNDTTLTTYSGGAAAYGGGVCVALPGTSYNGTSRSLDGGITWASGANLSTSQVWKDIAYGNGVFIAVPSSGGQISSRSTNLGTSWSVSTLPGSGSDWSIAFGNGVFVAVGNGSGGYSTDGVSWTLSYAGTMLTSITFGNGLFVAVTGSTSTACYTSTDGATWTPRSIPIGSYVSVAYSNGLFVAVAVGSSQCAVSTNGINWVARPQGTSGPYSGTSHARTLAAGDGVFVHTQLSVASLAVSA